MSKDIDTTIRIKEHCHVNKIRIAGVRVSVNYPDKLLDDMYIGYQDNFEVPDITVIVSENEIEEILAQENATDNTLIKKSVAIQYNIKPQVNNIVLRKIADYMPYFNTILMHGAVIALNGLAYMFVAPSGVGKTTRIKLWLKEYKDSIIVNGDKPFIMINDICAMACGSPWCGKEGWNTNIITPLRAIFLLERADDGKESAIEEINIARAFPILLQQTYRPQNMEAMRLTIMLIKSLQDKVKIYRFCSTPTIESIKMAYEISKP